MIMESVDGVMEVCTEHKLVLCMYIHVCGTCSSCRLHVYYMYKYVIMYE